MIIIKYGYNIQLQLFYNNDSVLDYKLKILLIICDTLISI